MAPKNRIVYVTVLIGVSCCLRCAGTGSQCCCDATLVWLANESSACIRFSKLENLSAKVHSMRSAFDGTRYHIEDV